jgi:chromosome transmission fidelity protein 18
MQPNLRPVNTHLYSQREKEDLRNLVDLLICYNLNFVQERTLEGNYIYR